MTALVVGDDRRERSGSTSGARKCLTFGNVPMSRPRGMATAAESRNPIPTRYRLQPALRTSASSKWRTGKAPTTSVGEGRMIGGTIPP